MSDEKIKELAFSPFVIKITFAVLKSIKYRKIAEQGKYIIDSDLVPKVSRRAFLSSISGDKLLNPFQNYEISKEKEDVKEIDREIVKPIDFQVKKEMPKEVKVVDANFNSGSLKSNFSSEMINDSETFNMKESIMSKDKEEPLNLQPVTQVSANFSPSLKVPEQKESLNLQPVNQVRLKSSPVKSSEIRVMNEPARPPTPAIQDFQVPSGEYGKIQGLINDPSVTLIECTGPGQQVLVVRAGQKQITRIVLTPEEITEILRIFSEKSHIPLIEGVFRAVVDNMSISAIVSNLIGSKFIIKKQTPYSILEQR